MKQTAASQSTAERTATDDRLRTERQRTDDELSRTRAEHDLGVDRMLRESRARMDRVADDARRATEDALASADARTRDERARAERNEDAARAEERSRQDVRLARERAALERDVMSLLSRERGETDERLLQERIRADAEIGSRDDVLAMVSHDLRGMLHGIAMSATLLRTVEADRPTTEAISRESHRIERFVIRMNRLIEDLLDVARIDAGKLGLVLGADDPVELLREAGDAAQPLAEAKGIRLTCEHPAGPLCARYDRERILQVLTNLIGNAIKFTGAGGRIVVSVKDVDAQICFKVEDSGSGILPEKLERIFERFSQGEARRRSGLGLGLYISRRIADAHGGRIWAESRPGAGSVFHLALPIAPTVTSEPRSSAPDASAPDAR